jgi:hypothetical protein
LVGDDASNREDLMVEIRVAVPDAPRVDGLLRRLSPLFERSSVSFEQAGERGVAYRVGTSMS